MFGELPITSASCCMLTPSSIFQVAKLCRKLYIQYFSPSAFVRIFAQVRNVLNERLKSLLKTFSICNHLLSAFSCILFKCQYAVAPANTSRAFVLLLSFTISNLTYFLPVFLSVSNTMFAHFKPFVFLSVSGNSSCGRKPVFSTSQSHCTSNFFVYEYYHLDLLQ